MTTATCQGTLRVGLPLAEALPLFTAEGERRWVPGWQPRYPAPVTDDTAPGTVWLTESEHGLTHWVVAERSASGYTYARTVPGFTAGTVRIDARGDGDATHVTVTYRLTALRPEAEAYLDEFAAQFEQMLGEWHRLIEAWCATAAEE